MSKQITRRKVLAGGAGALALSAVGIRGASAQANRTPIKIGVMLPLTGLAAASSIDVKMGIEIAAAHINAEGGVDGRPIELVMRDDKANPNDAVGAVRDLLGEGVKFLLGGSFTATTLAILPAQKEAGALFVGMTASTMRLGHQDFNKMAFHFFPNPYMSMRSEAKVIAQKYPNVTKWVSVGPDVEYGHIGWSAFAGGLKEFYPKYNNKQVKLLEPVWTKFGSNDFKAAVSAVMFSEAEGIYTTLTGADLATFLTQGKAQGLYDKIKVYGDIFNDVQTGKTMGRNNPSNYWTGTTWYPEAPSASALSKRTYADYKAKLPNQEPLGLLNCGYGSLKGIVAGMRAAKSVDPVVVAAAMENLKFETPSGISYFRKEDHQNVLPLGVVRMGPTDPGKAPVVEYVSVDTAEAIEPPSPGKEFPFPVPAVG